VRTLGHGEPSRLGRLQKRSRSGWFAEADIPLNLSLERVLPSQIKRMFEHDKINDLATDFD
jgi:hypothetical protein